MILEGIVTTENADGTVNVSPMGPTVDADMRMLVLRPYPTSKTFSNLKRTGEGVFHVTDDVELLARAAVGDVRPPPAMDRAARINGWILRDCCRWYAFRVRELDESQVRMKLAAEVVDSGRMRDFLGFNRAKHAVVEAAILATRTAFLPADEIFCEFRKLKTLVEKTGDEQEHKAFAFLEDYVRRTVTMDTETPANG